MRSRTSGPDTRLSFDSALTIAEGSELDDLWAQALQKALDKLPAKDSRWLADIQNHKAFTSTQIGEVIRPFLVKYSNHPAQRFLARIDPIVSHVRSFAGAINAFTNNSMGAGVVWGSIYLVLIVAGKTQRSLERILDFLSELSPQLALFARWHRFFPQRSFAEVGDAITHAYSEIIGFCATVVRHLRRNPMKNILHAILKPSMEDDLQRHEAMLRRYTARVKTEVDTAHMQFVRTQLAAIGSVIDAAPTPNYLELPSIRIIPHSRNDRFFGRQGILAQIREKLLPSKRHLVPLDPPKQQRFALSGLGGSGKTQIALEYTYRHLNDYKAVIWILADSPEKISQGFGETADILGMPKGTQSSSQARTFVLQRLSATNEPYLLCFDNADDLSLIKDCFPRDNTGTILITSRDSVGIGEIVGNAMIVPEFSIREGSDFLSSLLLNVDMSESKTRVMLEDISTSFHGYPLALAQAAAFIRNGGCSLAEFLSIFQDKRHSNAIASIPVEDYHATLFTVWDLSFHSLTKQSRQILEMLVYFDPDSVPYELLEKGCIPKITDDTTAAIDLSYMANPVDLWTALTGLRAQSLIRINPELKTISIHRFLQDQAFKRLCFEPSRRRKALEESLFVLSNHQPEFPNVTQHWSPDLFRDSQLCLAHIKRLATRFLESPEVFTGLENKVGKLIFECASYQFERFHHRAATDTFVLARKVIELASTPNELCLSDCYRMEGRMFNESGDPTRAEKSNRQAQKYALAAISKGYIGEDDQRMPRILTGLGNSLSQLRKFDDALEVQLEAKRICGDVPPEQSDAITIIQLNLGFLLYRRGDLNNAEQILRATLEASPKTPPAMYALGNTLLAQGKVEEAIAVHLNGLEIYIGMFGDQHALVARCAYKVGEILLLHKAYSKLARIYIEKAIDVYLKQESPYYTEKAYGRAARMLAKAFEMEGQQEEAKKHYEKAWALREKIDGIRGSPHDKDMDYTSVMFYWDQ